MTKDGSSDDCFAEQVGGRRCKHGHLSPCTECFRESEIESLRSSLSSFSKEISRLKGEVEMANSRVDHLESEREAWGKALKDNHALKAENEALRGALSKIDRELEDPHIPHHRDAPNVSFGEVTMSRKIAQEALARSPSSFAEESKALRGLERTVMDEAGPWMSACLSDELSCVEIKNAFSKVFDALAELDRVRGGKS